MRSERSQCGSAYALPRNVSEQESWKEEELAEASSSSRPIRHRSVVVIIVVISSRGSIAAAAAALRPPLWSRPALLPGSRLHTLLLRLRLRKTARLLLGGVTRLLGWLRGTLLIRRALKSTLLTSLLKSPLHLLSAVLLLLLLKGTLLLLCFHCTLLVL